MYVYVYIYIYIHLQYFFHWERCSHTFSSQTLFISVFYMDMQYECDNVFPNLKCVLEPFFLEKSTIYIYIYMYIYMCIYIYIYITVVICWAWGKKYFPLKMNAIQVNRIMDNFKNVTFRDISFKELTEAE